MKTNVLISHKDTTRKICFFLFGIALSCSQTAKKDKSMLDNSNSKKENHNKPGSTYEDTLIIYDQTAVFYQPDSSQLDSIRLVTDSSIFDASMHEYFYQIKNSHIVLKKNWSQIKIVDSKNVRYLNFIKSDKSFEVLDLNNYNDGYGMFIFDGKKSPTTVDMTNMEEAIHFYFSN